MTSIFNSIAPTNRWVPLAVGLALVLCGCEVNRRVVANEPPDLQRGVNVFATEVGTLHAGTTVFLWPRVGEAELTETIAKVNRASMEMDRLQVLVDKDQQQLKQLETTFAAAECVAKWADVPEGQTPDPGSWIETWKPGTPEAECIENQNQRKQLKESIASNGSGLASEQMVKLQTALDPDQSKVENMLSMGAKGSKITFKPDGSVSVVLRDFIRAGVVHATEAKLSKPSAASAILAAQYLPTRKLLVIHLPDIADGGKPTGLVWSFVLERAPDFLGQARFVGPALLQQDGKVVRFGTAKIEGLMR